MQHSFNGCAVLGLRQQKRYGVHSTAAILADADADSHVFGVLSTLYSQDLVVVTWIGQ